MAFVPVPAQLLSEQGWSVAAMEWQLDHKEKDPTVAAFARSEYLPERRKMMHVVGYLRRARKPAGK